MYIRHGSISDLSGLADTLMHTKTQNYCPYTQEHSLPVSMFFASVYF
jgi:hypothetical protein